MDDNTKKGGGLIIISWFAVVLILPFFTIMMNRIIYSSRVHFLYEIGFVITKIPYIAVMAMTVFGIKTILDNLKENSNHEDTDMTMAANSELSYTDSSDKRYNKIIQVDMVGGIIGLLSVNPAKTLEQHIQRENKNGWEVEQVIAAGGGTLAAIVVRLLILCCTLFFYTINSGYYVILTRKGLTDGDMFLDDEALDMLIDGEEEITEKLAPPQKEKEEEKEVGKENQSEDDTWVSTPSFRDKYVEPEPDPKSEPETKEEDIIEKELPKNPAPKKEIPPAPIEPIRPKRKKIIIKRKK